MLCNITAHIYCLPNLHAGRFLDRLCRSVRQNAINCILLWACSLHSNAKENLLSFLISNLYNYMILIRFKANRFGGWWVRDRNCKATFIFSLTINIIGSRRYTGNWRLPDEYNEYCYVTGKEICHVPCFFLMKKIWKRCFVICPKLHPELSKQLWVVPGSPDWPLPYRANQDPQS